MKEVIEIGTPSLSQGVIEDWLREHPAVRCPDVLELKDGIVGYLIRRACDPELARKGLAVVKLAFPGDTAAENGIRAVYEALQQGERVERHGGPAAPLSAEDWERVCFYVFLKEQEAVAIGGLYRYLIKPDEYWLARLGVVPAYQTSGLGTEITGKLKLLLQAGDLHQLYAFTEANPENKAHRFYRKRGWTLEERTVQYGGVPQSVYRWSF